MNLRVGLEESGEKEDLKATGERAVDGAIGGEGDEGFEATVLEEALEGETELDF